MVKKQQKENTIPAESASLKLTNWVGTPQSILAHTLFFVGMFALRVFNVPFDTIMLVLTTAVSLEAIYLAIFIQMTVNRNTQSLAGVEKDIDEIQLDVDGIQEDVEDLEEDLDDEEIVKQRIENIETQLLRLVQELENLKKDQPKSN